MLSDDFVNPLDSMPIANGSNKYAPPEKMKDLDLNPRPEEEIADMHEKAYKLARAKYNPFSIGGSESIHDFE